MALAEARAAWQRTANRCFVQEDAKRAPKLACCPSASPSVKQVDSGAGNASEGEDATRIGFPPYQQNSSYSHLSPNSRWWLQHQPNYAYQMTFADDQLNLVEAEMESVGSNVSTVTTRDSEVYLQKECESFSTNKTTTIEALFDSSRAISATPINKDLGARKQELEVTFNRNLQHSHKIEGFEENDKLTNRDYAGYESSKKLNEVCFDSECNWFGDEKSEPWWRTAGKDELAYLVAQRSLSLIDNCDLPQPQKAHLKRDPYVDLCDIYSDGVYASSADLRPGISDFSRLLIHSPSKLSTENSFSRSTSVNNGVPGGDKQPTRTDQAMPESNIHENDPSKAQLLEALRHSQTRAREAENAAKQAYADKEHIVKLVFRQASQLFAYKQWFHLLQLENLYSQIRNNKGQPVTTIFPVMLPRVPQRTRKPRKNWQKSSWGRRGKQGCCKCNISKCAVVFAVGLSLVGAGMLLGWTIGWMLPTF